MIGFLSLAVSCTYCTIRSGGMVGGHKIFYHPVGFPHLAGRYANSAADAALFAEENLSVGSDVYLWSTLYICSIRHSTLSE